MFSDKQLALIAESVEDYGMLVDEDSADECGEILDIIEAHFLNKKWSPTNAKCSTLWAHVTKQILSQERKSFKFLLEFVTICLIKVEWPRQHTNVSHIYGEL